jgi:hypothetical protein
MQVLAAPWITLALALLSAGPASACACCSFDGWRHVATERLDAPRPAIIDRLQFAETARLVVTEADPAIAGVTGPATDYRLAVSRTRDGGFSFALRDDKGRGGTLKLALGPRIAIFEVDPRDAADDGGLGPLLYKEWKLTAKTEAAGLFAAAARGATLTLILRGRGRGCPDTEDFTAWTLVLARGDHVVLSLVGGLAGGGK